MRSVGFVVVGAILGSIAGLGSAAAERIWTDDIPTGRDFVKPPIPARPLSDAEREARGRMLALPLPAPLEISPLRAAVLDAITDLKAGSSDPDMQAAVDQLGTLYGSDLAGPFWTHESGYLPRARAVISEIRKVGDFGIDPDRIGITEQNLSLLKSGKVKGIRFETLAAICQALECQPGDLLEAVVPAALA